MINEATLTESANLYCRKIVNDGAVEFDIDDPTHREAICDLFILEGGADEDALLEAINNAFPRWIA